MRQVIFDSVFVLNETEQLMVFTTIFNKKEYGLDIVLNTALPIDIQDLRINKIVKRLQNMTRKDVM